MRTRPIGFATNAPAHGRDVHADRDVDRALRISEPRQPGETEWAWIGAALAAAALAIIVDYLFLGALTATFLLGLLIILIGVALLVPGEPAIKVARIVGVAIAVLIIVFLVASGLPLALVTAMSPVAQELQGNENGINNVGNSVNLFFIILTGITALVLIIWMWFAKKPWLIIVLNVLIPFSLFFFIGIAMQAAIADA